MKLNKEKLDQMVEAVMKVFYPAPTKEICDRKQYEDDVKSIRTALTPFCMEMTDEEIEGISTLFSTGHCHILDGMEAEWLLSHAFIIGAKFIRDGK